MIRHAIAVAVAMALLGSPCSGQTAAEWVVTGRALQDSGRHSDAVKAFEQAVRLDQANAAYRVHLAQALGDVIVRANVLRQPLLARRLKGELDRAAALDPRSVDARIGLMEYYLQAPSIAGGSESKARAMASEIAALNPMRGHFAQARIAQRQRDTVTTERAYRAALAVAPDSAAAYTQLAAFLHQRRRTSEAREVLASLLQRQPDNPAGLRALRRLDEPAGRRD